MLKRLDKKPWYDRRFFKVVLAILGLFGGITISEVMFTVRKVGTFAALPIMAPYVHGEIKTHADLEKRSRDSAIKAASDSTEIRCTRLVNEAVTSGTYNIVDKLARTWPAFQKVVDSTDQTALREYRQNRKIKRFLQP